MMGRQFTINYITGTPEYNVFVCDSTGLNCVYIDTISDSDLPYTKEIPVPFNTLTEYVIKIVDINGCEIIKQFP
jgi:hypothetical protein